MARYRASPLAGWERPLLPRATQKLPFRCRPVELGERTTAGSEHHQFRDLLRRGSNAANVDTLNGDPGRLPQFGQACPPCLFLFVEQDQTQSFARIIERARSLTASTSNGQPHVAVTGKN